MKRIKILLLVLIDKVQRKKALTVALILFFETLFFSVRNGGNALTVLSLGLSPLDTVKLFFSVLYDLKNTFSLSSFVLLFITAILQSFVFVIFYSYMKERNQALGAEKVSIVISTVLALFGTSCAACGGAVIAFVSSLGLVGTSTILFDSTFVLSVVIVLLLGTLYSLLKKVENPFVC